MEFLTTIREKDVFPLRKTLEDGVIFEDRLTGKAIVFDKDHNIALVGNKVNSFYSLPGGGIDDHESVENGIIRECLEEIGCKILLKEKIGVIDDYRIRDKKHCINYCYVAEVVGEKGKQFLIKEESHNGMHVIWVSFEKALEIIKKEMDQLRNGEVNFYNTGFNIVRDYFFLLKTATLEKVDQTKA